MSEYLTQAELDEVKCGTPGCESEHPTTGIALAAACHLSGGFAVWYQRADGLLTLRCKVCERIICRIEVAP